MYNRFLEKMSLSDKIYLVISTIMTTILGLVLPFSILIIFDRVLPNSSYDTLFLLFSIITITIIIDCYIKNQEEKVISKFMKKLEINLSNKIFNSICLSEIKKHKQLQSGEYLERISTISDIKHFFGGEILKAFINLFISIITIIVIYLINVWAGLTILISSLILFIIAYNISKQKMNNLQYKVDIEGLTTSKIIEIISNPLDIKSRNMEYRIESLMNSMIDEREDKSISYEKSESHFNLVLTLTQQISISLIVVIIAIDVINMNSSQGVMAAIIMLTNRYYSPYQQTIKTFSRWQINKLYISNIMQIIDMMYNHNKYENISDINNIKIILDHSKYINLNKGEIYILSGKSGTGKSYLASCIMQNIICEKIEILINNKKITDINYMSWKNHSLMINKNSCFIEGTIIDNLTSFRSKLNNTAYTLCENMGVRQHIDSLPLGFYTHLKSIHSYPFSRQIKYKLLLIRSILSDKKILIFDDIDNIYNEDFAKLILSNSMYRSKERILIIISNKIKPTDLTKMIFLQGSEL